LNAQLATIAPIVKNLHFNARQVPTRLLEHNPVQIVMLDTCAKVELLLKHPLQYAKKECTVRITQALKLKFPAQLTHTNLFQAQQMLTLALALTVILVLMVQCVQWARLKNYFAHQVVTVLVTVHTPLVSQAKRTFCGDHQRMFVKSVLISVLKELLLK